MDRWMDVEIDGQMDGQIDGRTDKPSYRDVCHIKKLIKSNPPSKKVSPLISCQSWHLFKKNHFFSIFRDFHADLQLTFTCSTLRDL